MVKRNISLSSPMSPGAAVRLSVLCLLLEARFVNEGSKSFPKNVSDHFAYHTLSSTDGSRQFSSKRFVSSGPFLLLLLVFLSSLSYCLFLVYLNCKFRLSGPSKDQDGPQ